MSGVRVKICGLRTMEDIRIVNAARPDYAGFIFDPSRKRYLAPENARLLTKFLVPEIRTVGVFVNPTLEMVLQYLAVCPVSCVQLHGQESNTFIEELRSGYYDLRGRSGGQDSRQAQPLQIIKAFTIRGEDDLEAAAASAADLVLLDHGTGGTGEAFDWSLVRNFPRPFLLAGGLRPENVGEAIRCVRPSGVDVSSGVEGSDGHKDAARVQAFMDAVRQA